MVRTPDYGQRQLRKCLRAEAIRRRDNIPPAVRSELSHRIIKRVINWIEENAIIAVQLYLSMRSEVETDGLLDYLLASAKIALAPVTDMQRRMLTPLRISDPGTDFVFHFYGMREPNPITCPSFPLLQQEVSTLLQQLDALPTQHDLHRIAANLQGELNDLQEKPADAADLHQQADAFPRDKDAPRKVFVLRQQVDTFLRRLDYLSREVNNLPCLFEIYQQARQRERMTAVQRESCHLPPRAPEPGKLPFSLESDDNPKDLDHILREIAKLTE